ncbi:MAG: large subunit ribosomal protein [Bacteroidota bacterium]|nr:large subunit ribosomal protein [Bacteroidota bacterium]
MSRIGKQPIEIPAGTSVTITDGVMTVKGPKGELSKPFNTKAVAITVEGNIAQVTPLNEEISSRALWGTYASHLKNMVNGVNNLFTKKLILEGVGFKSEVKGSELVLALGFSHPVNVKIPEGLTVTAEKNNITVSGIDKEAVGEFTASTRALKKPEPYKGKGFRYSDEVIRRKQGKKTA